MSQNDETVIYRDLEERDIDELALLLASIWWASPDGVQADLEFGTVDLANLANRATFAQVAEMDGEVIGYIAARCGNPDFETKNYWRKLGRDAYSKIEEKSYAAAKDLADYYVFEEHAHNVMLNQCDEDLSNELVLFAVADKARGRGVGSTLLKLATDYLKSQGAKNAFLFTDTSCNWQYYEKRGMERIAKYKSSEKEIAEGRPCELYIYKFTF